MAAHDVPGHALALASAVLFGLVNVAARASTLHPLTLAAASYLVAGLVLVAFLRGAQFHRRDLWRIGLMALTGGAAGPVLLFYGLEHTTAADASLLLTLEMVFTAVLARVFLGERLTPRARAGALLLFASAVLVALAGLGQDTAPDRSIKGALLVLAAALGWGADNTVSTALAAHYRPHHLIALKGVLGGLLVGGAVLVTGAPWYVPQDQWPIVAFIGLLGVSASTVLMVHAFRRVGATRTVTLFIPTVALAGIVGGRVALGEPVGWAHAVGAVLVIAGVWLMVGEGRATTELPP